ncbi:MAG: hypothetical protein ACJAS1_001639 [Oleiphilaceae bacterium]|jgi:hypothetical protein
MSTILTASNIKKEESVITDSYTVFINAVCSTSIDILATSEEDAKEKAKAYINARPVKELGLEYLKKSIEITDIEKTN